MAYHRGISRHDVWLFPEALEDYIKPENLLRFLDAYVASLDFVALGFTHATPAHTGRPGYDPADLLCLYLYGYLNRVRSSRGLEREAQRNVELMWLLGKLTPDFKTIADFRKDNLEAIKGVCREFTLLCRKLELFGSELVAIDGSKFKAVNNHKRNFNQKRLDAALKGMDEKIDRYLRDLDEEDAQEADSRFFSKVELDEKIKQLQERKQKYQSLSQKLKASGETQVSLTDPDSRLMTVGQTTDVCYNVQVAVDANINSLSSMR